MWPYYDDPFRFLPRFMQNETSSLKDFVVAISRKRRKPKIIKRNKKFKKIRR